MRCGIGSWGGQRPRMAAYVIRSVLVLAILFGGRRDEEARHERDRQQRGSSKSVDSGHDPLHAPLGALVTHLPNRRASRCGSFA